MITEDILKIIETQHNGTIKAKSFKDLANMLGCNEPTLRSMFQNRGVPKKNIKENSKINKFNFVEGKIYGFKFIKIEKIGERLLTKISYLQSTYTLYTV